MISLKQQDVIFISYREPNADENWKHLKSYVPKAKRVHGVKGFDAAHKEAASLSSTPRFITVDGDNWINPKFFTQNINFDEEFFKSYVFSWSSKNSVNGLVYGNGGIKSWDVDLVKNMKTHENSEDSKNITDFLWEVKYLQVNDCWSNTVINKSSEQAFRAGLREGVKLTLNQGKILDVRFFKDDIHRKNQHRLQIYYNIGSDVAFGYSAMMGARLGTYWTYFKEWDFSVIQDYDLLDNIEFSPNDVNIQDEHLVSSLNSIGFDILDIKEDQSRFMKNYPISVERILVPYKFWDVINYQLNNWYRVDTNYKT